MLLPISIPWGGFQPTLRIFLAPSLISKEDIDNSQSNYNPDKVVASECSDLRDLCNLKKLSMQQTDLNLRHLNFKLFTGTKIMDFQGKQFIHSCVFISIFPC